MGSGRLARLKWTRTSANLNIDPPKESPLKGSVGESNRNEQALPRFKPRTVAEEQQPGDRACFAPWCAALQGRAQTQCGTSARGVPGARQYSSVTPPAKPPESHQRTPERPISDFGDMPQALARRRLTVRWQPGISSVARWQIAGAETAGATIVERYFR